jgi:two-component system chemotaxis response regulator CheY
MLFRDRVAAFLLAKDGPLAKSGQNGLDRQQRLATKMNKKSGSILAELKLRALIIDDQETMRKIVTRLLSQIGISDIAEAENGRQALDRLQERGTQVPDVAICDLHMAEMDGLEFMQTIRRAKDAPYHNLPIVLLTGESDDFLLQVAEQVGAARVLQKPVSALELGKVIMQVIGIR